MRIERSQIYAALLVCGALILLGRTLIMIYEGALWILVPWVSALLIAECLLGFAVVVGLLSWMLTRSERQKSIALRIAAAVVFVHAARVLIFVLGRTGPWINFDVRPEERAMHGLRWTWGELYFAAIISIISVAVVAAVWRHRRTPVPND